MDDGLYKRALNESATRGLLELFMESTEELGLLIGDASWLRRKLCFKDTEIPVTEIHMVALPPRATHSRSLRAVADGPHGLAAVNKINGGDQV